MVYRGNICRSPMAEAVLAHLAPAWTVDPAGTGNWHAGEQPDRSTLAELRGHGIATPHRGHQVRAADFRDVELIQAMDGQNLADQRAIASAAATAQMRLLGECDPQGAGAVPDPDDLWYNDPAWSAPATSAGHRGVTTSGYDRSGQGGGAEYAKKRRRIQVNR